MLYAIDSGGLGGKAANGTTYTEDNFFTGGDMSNPSKSAAIANTTDDFIYQTERYGTFSYNFPINTGSYEVTLHMAEGYFSPTQAGNRVFSVEVEGKVLVKDYDPLAVAGPLTANDLVLKDVAVSDGSLDLNFTASKDMANITGITIKGAAGSVPAIKPPPTPLGCTDPGIILCEDFEKVGVGAVPAGWNAVGARKPSVATTGAHSGTHSLRVSAFDYTQSGFIERSNIPAAHYGRIYYRFDTLTPIDYLHIPMVILHNAADGREVRVVDVNSSSTLGNSLNVMHYLVNFPNDKDGAGSSDFTSFLAAKQDWQCVEWRADPTTKTWTVWVNGTQRISYKADNLVPTGNYNSISVGMQTYRGSEESGWIDDFALSANRIGCL